MDCNGVEKTVLKNSLMQRIERIATELRENDVVLSTDELIIRNKNELFLIREYRKKENNKTLEEMKGELAPTAELNLQGRNGNRWSFRVINRLH